MRGGLRRGRVGAAFEGRMTMGQSMRKLGTAGYVYPIIGAGIFWAWMDALFMGSMLPGAEESFAADAALIGVSALGALLGIVACRLSPAANGMFLSKRGFGMAAVAGTVGSVLFAFANSTGIFALEIVGMALGAVFSTFAIVNWGVSYCVGKAEDATVLVAGSIAVSLVVDALLLTMAPVVRMALSVCLPLLSYAVWVAASSAGCTIGSDVVDRLNASTEHAAEAGETKPGHPETAGEKLYRMLGITPAAMVGLVLVMLCFGYMQCLMSSDRFTVFVHGGFVLQVARGVAAFVLALIALAIPRLLSGAFKAGLLCTVAGFLLLPFTSLEGLSWAAGIVMMAGYTFSDVFIWVLVVKACCSRSGGVLRTILVARQVVNGLCISLGVLLGSMLPAMFPEQMQALQLDSVVVGYVATIAAVLVVGSKDVWMLFEAAAPTAQMTRSVGFDDGLAMLGKQWGLTPREFDVFKYVAIGRSQPWIAESLCIAESTAKTHIRHIYQKADVSSKQELLDKIAGEISTEKD